MFHTFPIFSGIKKYTFSIILRGEKYTFPIIKKAGQFCIEIWVSLKAKYGSVLLTNMGQFVII